jgi:hypothetical protein
LRKEAAADVPDKKKREHCHPFMRSIDAEDRKGTGYEAITAAIFVGRAGITSYHIEIPFHPKLIIRIFCSHLTTRLIGSLNFYKISALDYESSVSTQQF